MNKKETKESNFDEAIGKWVIEPDPSRPDPTGVCHMYRWDMALIMYFLHHLLVTRWGPKIAIVTDDTIAGRANLLEYREARLRFRMKCAKENTDRVHMSRDSLRKIELYWQSIACTWMMKLAQTCRWWNARVKTYHTSVGPGYLHKDATMRDRMLVAEQKFRVHIRVNRLNATARDIRIHIATHLVPTALECEAMMTGSMVMRMLPMSEKIGHYALMDVWNRGQKSSIRKMLKITQSIIEKRYPHYACVIRDALLPDGKDMPLHAKSFQIVVSLTSRTYRRR